ncbi:hypothetical protein LCGC14_0451180 [marine sediment metagenome]|uniref:Uncharacterized protein n=1 Tax=marine sediment metagenome TaxID=412755 RepID=A0A0F9T122_9ZZZZ
MSERLVTVQYVPLSNELLRIWKGPGKGKWVTFFRGEERTFRGMTNCVIRGLQSGSCEDRSPGCPYRIIVKRWRPDKKRKVAKRQPKSEGEQHG